MTATRFWLRVYRPCYRVSARIFRRPAVQAGTLVLLLAFLTSILLWQVEQGGNPSYATYRQTLLSILVLLLSGFDVQDPPSSTLGWISAITVLCLGIAFVALLTGDVASWMVKHALGGRIMLRVKLTDHIVICGWTDAARNIINQLLSEDINNIRHIVIVDDKITDNPVDDPFVYFVRGDPSQTEVLERAAMGNAETAIVITDSSLNNPSLQDSKTALITLAIESLNPDVYTCVELMSPQNKEHLLRANADEIICVSEMSYSLLVQAAVNHGLSRFFTSCVTFDVGSEIYKVPIAERMVGRTFREMLVELGQDENGVILIGVERQRDGEPVVHANPQGAFPLEAGDELFVLAADVDQLTRCGLRHAHA
jgi:voltage-gated potassium channel